MMGKGSPYPLLLYCHLGTELNSPPRQLYQIDTKISSFFVTVSFLPGFNKNSIKKMINSRKKR